MNDLQQSSPSPNSQQPQPKNNKTLVIILSSVIGALVLLGSCGVYVAYRNAQKEAEEARVAKEKAEEEKRALQRSKEEAERKAEEERAARKAAEEEQAARKAEEEKAAREEAERVEREEAESRQPANTAKGQVVSVNKRGDWEFVRGEADAGYWVTTVVKNVGESGDIQVVTFLSCSEGEWTRTQHLYFRADESMTLRYFFHEPSINVTNCQARAGVSP